MTIKIPVQADTGSSAQDLNELERSFNAIAKAVERVEAAAKRTAGALDSVAKEAQEAGKATEKVDKAATASTRDPSSQRGLREVDRRVDSITRNSERLARVQGILGKTFGREFSADEASRFVRGYEMNRRMSPRLREFSDVVDFHDNTGRAFGSDAAGQRRAAQYRREVMNRSMVAGGMDLPGHPPAGGGGVGGGSDVFGAARKRGIAGARAFAGGMLAMAGITTIMGMTGRAVDMATEEAVGTDTLKRTMGDLGVDFKTLRDEVRGAGIEFGMASVEAMRLAQHFTKVADADQRDDIAREINTAGGFARAYGLDPNTSATFFGQMRQFGVSRAGGGDNWRMASMVADAVNRGGMTAKVDELLSAVSNFTAQATRLTLTAPNIEGFLGMMAGMTRTELPGLTPQVSADILGAADSAMRRGGAFGEASMNFAYSALARGTPGLGPVQAQMLMGHGLFGSAREAFGQGSAAQTWAKQEGVALPSADDATTNLEAVKEHLKRQGFDPWLRLDALKNFFGLQSIQQAMALDTVRPETVTQTQGALKSLGMGVKDVSADAWMSLSAITNAGDSQLRGKVLSDMLGRTDVAGTDTARRLQRIAGEADRTGDYTPLRNEMIQVAAELGRETTDGDKTRQSIADLNNTLTEMGDDLLPLIAGIRSGVAALVDAVAPDSEAASRFREEDEYRNLKKQIREAPDRLKAIEEGAIAPSLPMRGYMGGGYMSPTDPRKEALGLEQSRIERLRELGRKMGIEDNVEKFLDSLELSALDPKHSSRRQDSSEVRHTMHGEFHLVDPRNGQSIADPLMLNGVVGGPVSSGAAR